MLKAEADTRFSILDSSAIIFDFGRQGCYFSHVSRDEG
ncbi:hypothetical protein D1AOALGA4SA_2088 [Olavius algarvensis Delta 1 endosymbiont]|nr:hypothetical protein D1AOALGA4SA_2088 [Olavius algarvensis Delta 1 endosymbiont]